MDADSTPRADPTRLREHVAEELRVLLARRRMSGVQLAKHIGKSHTYVWRRLNGETAFDLDDLERIGAVLGVEPIELLPSRVRRSGALSPHETSPAGRSMPTGVDRPRDNRPSGRPGGAERNSPPNGASTVVRARRRGVPAALAATTRNA